MIQQIQTQNTETTQHIQTQDMQRHISSPRPPTTLGGAVKTVMEVATVANPGTPPFPSPSRREMAMSVGN